MLFDRLARLAERCPLAECWREPLQRAALFVLDNEAQQDAREYLADYMGKLDESADLRALLAEHAFLPFPVTAVEFAMIDSSGEKLPPLQLLALFEDRVPNAEGLSVPRRFALFFGVKRVGMMDEVIIYDADVRDVALSAFLYLNNPDRFVVEHRAVNARTSHAKGRVARSPDRPVYRMMTPAQIHRYIKPQHVTTGTHAAPVPHPRRAHWRMYRSERYVNWRNRTQRIPATWVGPTEAMVGRLIYRVILEK